MLGQNFPISQYYKENILDARTLTNRGGWWSAVLLIKDPRTNKPFIGYYRWQYTDNGWKARNRVHLKNRKDAKLLIEFIEAFMPQLE